MNGEFQPALSMDRRSLLKLAAALGAAEALPWRRAWATGVAVRPDIDSAAGRRMLGIYARAVRIMRAPELNFPPQPHSWTFQANIHNLPVDPYHPVDSPGFSPGSPEFAHRIDLIYGQPRSGTPNADWKTAALKCWATCPHGSPWFLAWHRWYIFYLEQVVRSVTGQSDFALPYWNYASDMGPSLLLPAAFTVRDPADQLYALYEDVRGLGFYNPAGTGAQNLPMNDGGYLPFLATDYGPALSGTSLFPSDSSTSQPLPDPRYYSLGFTGRVELQPHDNVHVNVGGLMSNVPVAAVDPIFFVHHCQIDRLWATWQSIPNVVYNYGSSGTDPGEKEWGDRKFSFVDAAGRVVEVTTAGQLDTTAMGYRYDVLARLVHPSVAATASVLPAATPSLTLPAAQATGIRIGSSGARVILVPGPQANQAAAAVSALRQPSILVLQGVRLLSRPPAPLHVFLNLPEGTSPDITDSFHVGMLNFFNWDTGTGGPMQEMMGPHGHVSHMMSESGQFRFAVGGVLTRQKADGLWDGRTMTVTITTLGADRSRGNIYVTIGRVLFVP